MYPKSAELSGVSATKGTRYSATFAATPLVQVYEELACGFFSNGFTREVAPNPWVPFLDDPEIFMPCLRDPQKLQIRAQSSHEVQELANAKGIPTLVSHAKPGACRLLRSKLT
jgi:hypothetical protein